MPPSAPLEPGHVVADKYRLHSLLGRGGMGEVWQAEHLVLRAPVAVKFMDPQLALDPASTARFLREAQSAAALRSVHVVQILDYGIDGGMPFMAMEFLEGESLAARLQREGRLSPAETAHVMTHVARAVGRAHQSGIVHRDLKPENMFLVPTGDETIVKVLDFGIAKVTSSDVPGTATRTGAVMGTPYYMSPEQAQGTKVVDYRSDLWSLGVITYECLTGQRPFDSDALGELILKICAHPIPVPSDAGPVPSGFDAWFAKAVNRDPAVRFESAKALADSLRELCGGPDPRSQFGIRSQAVAPSTVAPGLAPAVAVAATAMGSTAQPIAITKISPNPLEVSSRRSKGAAIAVVLAAVLAASALAAGAIVFLRGKRVAPQAEAEPAAAPSATAPSAPPPVVPTVSATPEPPQPVAPEPSATEASRPASSAAPHARGSDKHVPAPGAAPRPKPTATPAGGTPAVPRPEDLL